MITGTEMRELMEIACVTCEMPELAAKIHLRWNRRFTARMGDARWFFAKDRGVIRLSAPLWPKASREEQIETIVHETCHIIADVRFGFGQGHGPNWRALMRQCGYSDANRCHNVNREEIIQRRQQTRQTFRVSCGCPGGATMGRVQYQRLRAGRRYSCRKCGQSVILPQSVAATGIQAEFGKSPSRGWALCACSKGVRLGPIQMQRLRAGMKYRCRICRQEVRLP